MTWKLAEAKNKLSEVISRALNEGPQCVTRRGDAVIILSQKEYERLIKKRISFKDFLCDQNENFEDVNILRDDSEMREVDL